MHDFKYFIDKQQFKSTNPLAVYLAIFKLNKSQKKNIKKISLATEQEQSQRQLKKTQTEQTK